MAESRPIRILYMEDNPALARLLQKSLRRKGYEVDLVADGAAGLAVLEGTSYDLILADYDMPVCGGIEVLTTLAARGLAIPVIMVTGNGSEKVAVEALKRGAADYVVKDLEMGYIELLPIVIEQVMTRQELLREKELMIEMVRDREERYRRLVELSPDGIAIHVGERIAFINAAGARLLGASDPTGVVGRRVPDLVSPDYLGLVRDQLVSSTDAAPWFEERLTLRDGRCIDVEIAAVPFFYEGEEALQVIVRDITEKKLAKRRLEFLAHHDPLTGLANRVLFFDRLDLTLRQAERDRHGAALLFIDLDHFKGVNDTFGHDAGDTLLKEAARRIESCLRKADSVARMGGDEFTVILSRVAGEDDAAMVAGKILHALTVPVSLPGGECTVGASIGISMFPVDAADAETLLKKADAAMYRAKRLGKNCYSFADQEPGGGAFDPRTLVLAGCSC